MLGDISGRRGFVPMAPLGRRSAMGPTDRARAASCYVPAVGTGVGGLLVSNLGTGPIAVVIAGSGRRECLSGSALDISVAVPFGELRRGDQERRGPLEFAVEEQPPPVKGGLRGAEW